MSFMHFCRYTLLILAFVGVIDIFAFFQFKYILNLMIQPQFFFIPSLLGFIFGTIFFFFRHYYLKAKEKEIYEEIAKTDHLTGALSRFSFSMLYQNEFDRYKRTRRPFSLIMFDIDDFKQVNDTFGHQVGDCVLRELCTCVRHELRSIDMLCRWGGEEFVIILPETPKKEIATIAERIRERVSHYDFRLGRPVTVSIGGIEINDENGWDSEMFLKKVDEALYTSKQEGKNRTEICCHGS